MPDLGSPDGFSGGRVDFLSLPHIFIVGGMREPGATAGSTNPDLAPSGQTLPQVVLLDLKLPKVDGLDVLRRVRGNDRAKRLPVVILPSSTGDKDRLTGYDLGANSHIRTQVEFLEFTEAVRQLGFSWLALNVSPPS